MSKKRVDVMLDIETLGIKNNTTIFQLSAVAFDIANGDIISEFDKFIDISSIKNLNVDGSTIKWWLQTNPNLFAELVNNKNAISEIDAYTEFYNWIKELQNKYSVYMFGNGISFDVVKVKTKMEELGLPFPISYKNERDVRTLIDLVCTKNNISEKEYKKLFNSEDLVAHNGLDDCKYQIKYVVYAYNSLIK